MYFVIGVFILRPQLPGIDRFQTLEEVLLKRQSPRAAGTGSVTQAAVVAMVPEVGGKLRRHLQ